MMPFEPEMGFTDENGVQVAEAAVEVSEEQEVTDPAKLPEGAGGACRRTHSREC